jgi:putative aldouronate transport system substrate-binding protein
MKKSFKRLLTAALTGALAVSMLAGCGKDKTNGGTVDNISKTVAGIEGWSAFKDKVTLRIPVYQRATPNGAADAANNYWTKWVQKEFGDKYNINVEYVALARGQENELYAAKAAAKQLPVCCFEYDYPDVTLYQSEGYFSEYDKDWFAHIAPTYWKAMTDNGLDKYTDINGETVLLIGTRPYGKTNYQFVTFYRADWVKAAGYDEYPEDPDELLKMYEKIKKLGPGGEHLLGGTKVEGNGVDQNYPYRTYPQDKLLWATTGDYSIPALSTEAQKAFLKWQNKLYNLGYIDDEYNTRTSDYAISDFVSGKTLTYSCYATNNVDVLNQFYKANPNASLGIVVNHGPKTFADGTCNAFRPNGIFGEYIGFSSQATEEEKTAFAMYLEWMSQPDILFTLQWGFEGVNFNYVNGTPVSVADQSGILEQQSHNNNVDMWCLVTATRSLGNVDKDIQAITPTGYKDSDAFLKQIKANYEGQLACYEAGLASPDCMFQVSIASSDEYKNTLLSKYAELRDKIVMGSEADFEKNYKAASDEYLKAGYQAIIDEKTKAFNEGKYN